MQRRERQPTRVHKKRPVSILRAFGSQAARQIRRTSLTLTRSPRPLPPPPPTTHRVLLVNKDGKRGIANHAEVLAFLQAGCDGQCAGLGADAVRSVSFSTMTIRDQLALVSGATLALSPPGGVSMILPFMPEGSHAILVNYRLSPKDNRVRTHAGQLKLCASCSWTMETELWRHVRWVRKLPYQVWEPSDFAGGRVGRDSAVQIKLPRLAYLVRVALDAMAPRRPGAAALAR